MLFSKFQFLYFPIACLLHQLTRLSVCSLHIPFVQSIICFNLAQFLDAMAPLLQPALYSFGGRMSQARTEPSRSHSAIWLNLSASVYHCLLRRGIVVAWVGNSATLVTGLGQLEHMNFFFCRAFSCFSLLHNAEKIQSRHYLS